MAPSGGRMDEIIRAVRDCPSGALSYAVDGTEARGQVDWDGRGAGHRGHQGRPYRITGGDHSARRGGRAGRARRGLLA